MTRFVAFEPAAIAATGGRSERTVFLRDRFSFFAFLVAPLWLARHRLFGAALAVLVLAAALGALGRQDGFGGAGLVLLLLLNLLVALEGPSLRAARYRRQGYRDVAVLEAGSEAEAAILYYAGDEVAEGDRGFERDGEAFAAAPASERGRRPGRTLLDPIGAR